MIMHCSRDWSCTDHVTNHALIIWLSCTHYVAIVHWSRGWSYWSRDWSCTDHVYIMHWSHDCPCSEHVDDHTLIMWQIMQWSRGYHALIKWLIILCYWNWSCNDHVATMYWSGEWSCTDHLIDHALISWLIMHCTRDWSCTDHMTHHALISWLSCTAHVADHAMIT